MQSVIIKGSDVPEQFVDDIYIVNDNDNNHVTIVATATKNYREGYKIVEVLPSHSFW